MTAGPSTPTTATPAPADERRWGNVLVFVLMLLALVGFAALVVDIGMLRMIQAQLQVATDAAALAGTAKLDHTAAGVTAATSEAISVGDLTPVWSRPAGFVPGDVEPGVYDGGVFTPSADAEHANAVRVTKSAEDIPTVFGLAAFGVPFLETSARSVAYLPPPEPATRADCFLPIAVPDCRFSAGQGEDVIDRVDFRMTNATADNAAWALPQAGNPSDSQVTDVLRRACVDDAMADATVSLNSGAMSNAFRELANRLNASSDAWDPSYGALPPQMSGSLVQGYGAHVLQGAVMLFQAPPSYCVDANGDGQMDGGGFNEDGLKITGLAWAVVYDVKGQGGGGQTCTGTGKNKVCVDDTSAGDVLLRLDLDYDEVIGTGGGGPYDGGVLWQGPPRIGT